MSRMNPTFDDIRETAESIKLRRGLFARASELKGQYFLEKFKQLPPELQETFFQTRESYLGVIESDHTKDPSLTLYYRKAAKRFHPDSIGSNEKEGLFIATTLSYQSGDLPMLQAIVLQDMVDDVNGLPEEDKVFLIKEHEAMRNVNESLYKKAEETVVAADEFYQMKVPRFEVKIREAIGFMQTELCKKGVSPEAPRKLSLKERF